MSDFILLLQRVGLEEDDSTEQAFAKILKMPEAQQALTSAISQGIPKAESRQQKFTDLLVGCMVTFTQVKENVREIQGNSLKVQQRMRQIEEQCREFEVQLVQAKTQLALDAENQEQLKQSNRKLRRLSMGVGAPVSSTTPVSTVSRVQPELDESLIKANRRLHATLSHLQQATLQLLETYKHRIGGMQKERIHLVSRLDNADLKFTYANKQADALNIKSKDQAIQIVNLTENLQYLRSRDKAQRAMIEQALSCLKKTSLATKNRIDNAETVKMSLLRAIEHLETRNKKLLKSKDDFEKFVHAVSLSMHENQAIMIRQRDPLISLSNQVVRINLDRQVDNLLKNTLERTVQRLKNVQKQVDLFKIRMKDVKLEMFHEYQSISYQYEQKIEELESEVKRHMKNEMSESHLKEEFIEEAHRQAVVFKAQLDEAQAQLIKAQQTGVVSKESMRLQKEALIAQLGHFKSTTQRTLNLVIDISKLLVDQRRRRSSSDIRRAAVVALIDQRIKEVHTRNQRSLIANVLIRLQESNKIEQHAVLKRMLQFGMASIARCRDLRDQIEEQVKRQNMRDQWNRKMMLELTHSIMNYMDSSKLRLARDDDHTLALKTRLSDCQQQLTKTSEQNSIKSEDMKLRLVEVKEKLAKLAKLNEIRAKKFQEELFKLRDLI